MTPSKTRLVGHGQEGARGHKDGSRERGIETSNHVKANGRGKRKRENGTLKGRVGVNVRADALSRQILVDGELIGSLFHQTSLHDLVNDRIKDGREGMRSNPFVVFSCRFRVWIVGFRGLFCNTKRLVIENESKVLDPSIHRL